MTHHLKHQHPRKGLAKWQPPGSAWGTKPNLSASAASSADNPPSQRLCVDSMGETSPVLKHKNPKLHKLLSVCDLFILKQHQPNLNTEMPTHRQTTFRRKFILQAVKMMLSLHHRWWWDWMLHCPDSREKKKTSLLWIMNRRLQYMHPPQMRSNSYRGWNNYSHRQWLKLARTEILRSAAQSIFRDLR